MLARTAQDAAVLLGREFGTAEVEQIAAIHLDAARQLIGIDRFAGSQAAAHVDLPIRCIVKSALDRGAAGLIVAHNHPSGDPHPSRADIEATRRLAHAVAPLDIRLHDHLIFAGGDCRSFRGLGLL